MTRSPSGSRGMEPPRPRGCIGLQLNPRASGPFCKLCAALFHAGRPSEAEMRCVEALRIDAQAACAHYNLGRLYLEQARMLDAESQLDAAVAIQPLDTSPV